MADVTITNTKLTAFNAFKLLAAHAATETTDATAQKFLFTPTGKDNHALIVASTAADDADTEALTLTIPAGDGPFAGPALSATLPGVAGLYAFQIETGRYMQSTGTIELTFTPGASKDIATDTSLKVYVCEMLPN
jgi:hypothetical protein